jgi:hypothetical protein
MEERIFDIVERLTRPVGRGGVRVPTLWNGGKYQLLNLL